jgi:hypothetical protein
MNQNSAWRWNVPAGERLQGLGFAVDEASALSWYHTQNFIKGRRRFPRWSGGLLKQPKCIRMLLSGL